MDIKEMRTVVEQLNDACKDRRKLGWESLEGKAADVIEILLAENAKWNEVNEAQAEQLGAAYDQSAAALKELQEATEMCYLMADYIAITHNFFGAVPTAPRTREGVIAQFKEAMDKERNGKI